MTLEDDIRELFEKYLTDNKAKIKFGQTANGKVYIREITVLGKIENNEQQKRILEKVGMMINLSRDYFKDF